MNVLDYYSVDKNVFKLYKASSIARNISNEANRLLKAEDYAWKTKNAKKLANIVLEYIASHFELFIDYLQSNSISEINKTKLMHIIPTNLPLTLSSAIIPESIYWERACYDNWTLGFFMPQFKGSWKILYMEKFLQNYIENTIFSNIHMVEFKELLEVLKPFIFSLTIEQFQVPDLEVCRDEDDAIHIDMEFILSSLSNLKNFDFACGVKSCDVDFSKTMYELNEKDCENIGKGLQWTTFLENFKIHKCDLKQTKLSHILSNFQKLSNLKVVDFMSCGLDDTCVSILTGILIKLSFLEELSLVNNKIGPDGAISLASSLEHFNSLKVLNLRLNFILDDGGIAIFEAISSRSNIEILILEGCEIGTRTVESLCHLITENNNILSIDLSVNHLHVEEDEEIVQAVLKNDTLQELALQMNNISSFQLKTISEKLAHNRKNKNKFHF